MTGAGRSFTLEELAGLVGAEVSGDGTRVIRGLGSLEGAGEGDISHLSSAAYRHLLATTRAGAIILAPEDASRWGGDKLVTPKPYLAFARVSQLFAREPLLNAGVHPDAHVAASARVDASAAIGPGVVIGERTRIGANVRIHANTVVGEDCELAADVQLMANVVLYADVRIGERSIVHSGAVLGADGFGYTPDERGVLVTIAQLGGVQIGADVSIGAATTIDRGAIDDTVIGDGVKIDNQVQIGHNVQVGKHSVICGCVGIVGSTRIGAHVVLAGGVGVGGDGPIEICDRVVVSGMTHVSASISEPGIYSGGVIHSPTRQWKRNALRLLRLDDLFRRVARLERLAGTARGRADSAD
ncbi:MAG: UDP-3-O-(3-hydroxymyristoyl)glucosamine N-acyltransferase [Pseudomonadales bacterium]